MKIYTTTTSNENLFMYLMKLFDSCVTDPPHVLVTNFPYFHFYFE